MANIYSFNFLLEFECLSLSCLGVDATAALLIDGVLSQLQIEW